MESFRGAGLCPRARNPRTLTMEIRGLTAASFWRVVLSEIRPHAPRFGSIAIGSDTDSGLPEVPKNLRSLRTEDI